MIRRLLTCLIAGYGVVFVKMVLAFDSNILVKDDLGEAFELQKPVKKIVSLAPNITELLFEIEAGDLLVGVDEFSDYPLQAKSIQRVNNYSTVNYELLVALQPDIIIAWASGNGITTINKLKSLGFAVFALEISSLDDFPNAYKRLGLITSKIEESEKVSQAFKDRLETIKNRVPRTKTVRTFYQIWHDPIMTISGSHIISEIISLCGGNNVFSEVKTLTPIIDMETIILKNPQAIISSGNRVLSEWVEFWRDWHVIDAVKQENIFLIPPDLLSRQTSRILDGAEYLCDYINLAR